jgi:hypothetical protein
MKKSSVRFPPVKFFKARRRGEERRGALFSIDHITPITSPLPKNRVEGKQARFTRVFQLKGQSYIL